MKKTKDEQLNHYKRSTSSTLYLETRPVKKYYLDTPKTRATAKMTMTIRLILWRTLAESQDPNILWLRQSFSIDS